MIIFAEALLQQQPWWRSKAHILWTHCCMGGICYTRIRHLIPTLNKGLTIQNILRFGVCFCPSIEFLSSQISNAFSRKTPPSFLSLICMGQRMLKPAWIHHRNRKTEHSVPSEYLLALLWVRSIILPWYRVVCFHLTKSFRFLSNGTCSVKSDSESQSA